MRKQDLKRTLKITGDRAKRLANSTSVAVAAGVDRLLDKRVCLGITGFSGSGKTTLITSLIHQLRYYPDAALTALPPALQDRLLGVEISPLKDLPLFPYQQGANALDREAWPQATRQASGCLLEIKYRARSHLIPGKKPGIGRLYLEIHDYPGEWLLDLPLLEMSYQDWCQQSRKLSAAMPEDPFLTQLTSLNLLEPLDPWRLNSLWQQQLDFLKRCQQKGLTMIQPGRLLHLAPDSPESHFPFIPLPQLVELSEAAKTAAPEDALYRICETNYQHYLKQWVKPFYKNTFQRIDRQLVLIDVLKSLNQGQETMDNLRLSLTQVLQNFEYGTNNIIRRLIQPRIDRIVFAASKIDQVLPDQHEQVRSLTASLVRESQRQATFKEVDIRCEAIASVRSTSYADHQGQRVLKGNTEEGPGLLLHPPLPEQYPDNDYWQNCKQWQLRKLLPPAGLKLNNGSRLPHIRLDSVLNDLLGDKFQ
ncbi:YcjX family protein [Endozoicomonas sp. 4G]|uniref:YcjX family protein n=1 Tax=Endozoicomonas sp. 4G TaxID=2872754 RepID=UPI00207907D3|nr:YcjX family protein [Endozoicomonas sp. 4G]